MANTTNNSPRQTHVSPGIYTKETDLTYASKSLGITTLGVVGETLRGPAFQPILVENWRQFQTYFGGTSVEKYKGSKYPKYELPYIAQSYLQQSNQLQVVRVLGLSGTNAGDAWLITASGDEETSPYQNLVIAVIRSRATYQKVALISTPDENSETCENEYEYDKQIFYTKDVRLEFSNDLNLENDTCAKKYITKDGEATIDATNYGKFTLALKLYDDSIKRYAVSFNPNEKDYIYNVIGGDPEVGNCEVFVEELYDVALQQLINEKLLNKINNVNPYGEGFSENAETMPTYKQYHIIPKFKAVNDLLTEDETTLRRKDVGKRFLYSRSESINAATQQPLQVHVSTDKGLTWTQRDGIPGEIYTVVAHTNIDGIRQYFYGIYEENTDNIKYKNEKIKEINEAVSEMTDNVFTECVLVAADNLFYIVRKNELHAEDVYPITLDLNNYKEQYRCATTPWIVSEIKGSANEIELTKLFRFHTISDGNNSNLEVKVSIENIDPENGLFDVVVRDFNDQDGTPIILERFNKCNLVPGNKNYIGLKIGSYDEQYETISKYITVEVNETEITKVSIPAGFLGYPIRNYETGQGVGLNNPTLQSPYVQYNTYYNTEIRPNKQYFGLSSIVGIDTDMLKYKGVEAYNDLPDGLTPCFHLDARIFNGKPNENGEYENDGITQKIFVDGITGYNWVTVDKTNVTEFGIEPRIGQEETMLNTIYEDKKLRKFTVAFYGGWDGWDYYRSSRTNTDDYKYSNYRGTLNKNTGKGTNFSVIGKKSSLGSSIDILNSVENYDLNPNENAITSDWYAYLSGIRKFANPKNIDINVLATPGIDYVNNKTLVEEVIDMVETERADAIYVVTTPDKPFGSGDTETEMFNADEVVWNLEDSDIDSNYTCTYYPWVKYYDENNSSYIYLPPTKDVVRNFAYTDNTAYPWFAAAGWNRGGIDGVRPKKSLKLVEQDTLYAGRINFVNTFAQEGMKIWGDNNLQVRESQMNKISKRRLLLRIRKLCSIACVGLLFDPNDNTIKQRFQSTIEPIMNDIMSNRGITNWKMEIDDSVEARDRLELPAKIYLKPTPNLEYITIDFIITPQGTNWDNV